MPATLHTTNIGRYVSEGITLLTFHFLLSAFDPIQQQTYIFSKMMVFWQLQPEAWEWLLCCDFLGIFCLDFWF